MVVIYVRWRFVTNENVKYVSRVRLQSLAEKRFAGLMGSVNTARPNTFNLTTNTPCDGGRDRQE